VIAPRSELDPQQLEAMRVIWTAPPPLSEWVGKRVALHRIGELPEGAKTRLEPDSVTLEREER